jgi:predicted dehydrogenase
VHFIDTFRYLLGEVKDVYANLRRLNPVIQGEETGQVFFRFANGATAVLDANRYNEVESPSPRYTFGQMRIDATGGHLTLDTEANLRLKPLGQPGYDVDYPHADINFAGDCVYALQRHFVESMRDGAAFEANGEDYLKTLAVVDAVYESARTGEVVRL